MTGDMEKSKKVGLEDLLEKTVEEKPGWRHWFRQPDWRNVFRGFGLIFLTLFGYIALILRRHKKVTKK